MLTARIELPHPRAEVFGFFADAANLEQLTPPWLRFSIVTPQPIDMRRDVRIEYRLQLHRVPVHWKTQIAEWDPPQGFVDEQISGPYRLWRHEHRFEAISEGGTRVHDRVLYRPRGGRLANWLLVERDVRGIFEFRHSQLLRRFP